MNPLNFTPDDVDQNQSKRIHINEDGIAKALKWGLIYMDPVQGPCPTLTFRVLSFTLASLDALISAVLTMALVTAIGWLIGQTLLVRLIPQAVLTIAPLWQWAACIGLFSTLFSSVFHIHPLEGSLKLGLLKSIFHDKD